MEEKNTTKKLTKKEQEELAEIIRTAPAEELPALIDKTDLLKWEKNFWKLVVETGIPVIEITEKKEE